ncbi:hypothetical protein HYV73_03045 [Candidatus Uhrbacteria bacterium]|nr:hypothetical protein [Candidatus Uhrbacteria bacterium]
MDTCRDHLGLSSVVDIAQGICGFLRAGEETKVSEHLMERFGARNRLDYLDALTILGLDNADLVRGAVYYWTVNALATRRCPLATAA